MLASLLAIPVRSWLGLDRGTTNRDYLVGLLDSGTLDQTARTVVPDARAQAIAAQCLKGQAAAYLASGNPYLLQEANRDTPTILALRFMSACGLVS
uniref:Uncharacterized protein n=1 Tax=Ralstonia solanacearum TaxID=305 RepID=A0A0S4UEI3_RALSL|nr:protein of unknown function [Ralstonia solanacearum]